MLRSRCSNSMLTLTMPTTTQWSCSTRRTWTMRPTDNGCARSPAPTYTSRYIGLYHLLSYYAPARRERAVCFAFVRPSVAYTYRITREAKGLAYAMKLPHLWCDSRTSFNVKRPKVKVIRPIDADTHPAAYLPMRTYRVPLVGVFLSHFRINCTKLACRILIFFFSCY